MRTAPRRCSAFLVALSLFAAGTEARAAEATKKSSTKTTTTSKSAKPPAKSTPSKPAKPSAKAAAPKKSTAPKATAPKKPAPATKPAESKKTSAEAKPSPVDETPATKSSTASETPAVEAPVTTTTTTLEELVVPDLDTVLPRLKKLPASFDTGRVAFSIRYGEVEGALETMSAFVMPDSTLVIEAKGGSGLYAASSRTGSLAADEEKPRWTWKAPAVHGDHQVRIRDRGVAGGDAITLNVFVLRPYDGGTTIGDYPVGTYGTPKKHVEAFQPPDGFVELTAKNAETAVSPHFRLGQFRCKDGVEGTTYLVLRPELLLKLELVLEELARRGKPAKTLHVMSGFRTPAYHAGIGNETEFSRHLYGDAADVFLDGDEDSQMDDLDGDGESTKIDALVFHALVDEAIDGKTTAGPLAGGLSAYGPAGNHGPFLHIDTRGQRVRW